MNAEYSYMPIENQSSPAHSPCCSSVGTQCSPLPVYENIDFLGSVIEEPCQKTGIQYQPIGSSEGTSSGDSSIRNDGDASTQSLDGSRKTRFSAIDAKGTNRSKRTIDMRPLSLPPPDSKRRCDTEKRCYVCLGLSTVAVFGLAFSIWLLYDSLEKFVLDLFN